MRENFNITGFFYELNEYKFRKFLNIKKKGSILDIPDLMVVMMNPGKSRPQDGIDNNDVESEAIPDNTQRKIIQLMMNCGIEFSRILNLSDVRETRSEKLYQLIPLLEKENIPHSIFDERRKLDFNQYFVRGVKTIFAWGVNNSLTELTKRAVESIGNENCFGVKKDDSVYGYYHPLPPNYHKQKEWIDRVTKQLITS